MPPALKNEPILTPYLRFYLGAFAFLSRGRSYGMSGPNPLTFREIRDYAEPIGYTSASDLFFFAEVMYACDQVYLEDYRKRAEAEAKSRKSQQSTRR
jgi:hypothetical protein